MPAMLHPAGRVFISGEWVELELDSRADASDLLTAQRVERVSVALVYLRSWQGMGVAHVRCVSGCACDTTTIDGTWHKRVTVMQHHSFKVGQRACPGRLAQRAWCRPRQPGGPGHGGQAVCRAGSLGGGLQQRNPATPCAPAAAACPANLPHTPARLAAGGTAYHSHASHACHLHLCAVWCR